MEALAVAQPQNGESGIAKRVALSSMASKTGPRLPGEELMTCKHLGGSGLLLQCLALL